LAQRLGTEAWHRGLAQRLGTEAWHRGLAQRLGIETWHRGLAQRLYLISRYVTHFSICYSFLDIYINNIFSLSSHNIVFSQQKIYIERTIYTG
jgi:hypothetical protein